MNARTNWLTVAIFAVAALAGAQSMDKGGARPLAQVKFAPDDDVKCLESALENGNPSKGASTFILKAPPNCIVPWHYHTAGEQLIVTQGNVKTEMDGMAAVSLAAGGFAMMPGKAKHQFSCQSKNPCVLFVTFDRTYDIFWVKADKTR
jgi:quercetin dioxygenase-like cupin family protein